MKQPATFIGLTTRRRSDGTPYLHGQLHCDLSLPAGSEFTLRKDSEGDGYVLQVALPSSPWNPSKRERERVQRANGPRGALRRDPRDSSCTEERPW